MPLTRRHGSARISLRCQLSEFIISDDGFAVEIFANWHISIDDHEIRVDPCRTACDAYLCPIRGMNFFASYQESRGKMEGLLYEDEVFQIRGAIFDVHNEMGAGFLEAVYQECLAHELDARQIPYLAHKPLKLTYKGRGLDQLYRLILYVLKKSSSS
jgi:hypothetical protein